MKLHSLILKTLIGIILLTGLAQIVQAQTNSDDIGGGTITITQNNAESYLQSKVVDLKDLMQYYQVALDSGSTITTPEAFSGTEQNPVMTVSVKKCVLIICQTVDLEM